MAKPHSLWKSGDTVMCRQCGAFSITRARHVRRDCGRPDRWAEYRMKKFFLQHLHPVTKKPLNQPPSFWRNSVSEHYAQPGRMAALR